MIELGDGMPVDLARVNPALVSKPADRTLSRAQQKMYDLTRRIQAKQGGAASEEHG